MSIVGAGMGGLAAAASLAARGARVTVLESAASPGGKMREVEVGATAIDVGPTVLTMRWVFERLFDDAGAALSDAVGLTRTDRLARHAWSERRAAGSLLRHRTQRRRDRRVRRRRARRTVTGASARAPNRIYETLRDRLHLRPAAGPVGLAARVGLTRLPDLIFSIRHSRRYGSALDGLFRRSASAPAVRPLRDLLRLVAVPRAGDADAHRPCRA